MTAHIPRADAALPAPGPAKILVIEDDAAMRALLEIYLTSFGYRVLLAPNGEEAVRLAAAHPDVRLMIVDLVMSGLSGRELVKSLEAILPGVAALFCSGHSARGLTAYGIELSAGNFLQKPCTPAKLKQKLADLERNALAAAHEGQCAHSPELGTPMPCSLAL